MFNRPRVIHLAVNNLKETMKDYEEKLGFKALPRGGDAPQLGIRNGFLQFGDMIVEVIEPLTAGQGPVAKFLETRGEGIYMMAWEVDDIDKAIKELQAKGVRLVNADAESRKKGLMTFVHPKSAHGIMVELVEKPK